MHSPMSENVPKDFPESDNDMVDEDCLQLDDVYDEEPEDWLENVDYRDEWKHNEYADWRGYVDAS